MQYALYAPSHIDATVKLPASKSISNRALIIHALSGAQHSPANISDCDDSLAIIHALNTLSQTIDVGGAGTAMRFLTAYLSLAEGTHTLTGNERMRHRPIGELVDALRYLGASIDYLGEDGYPPLRIEGHPMDGGSIEVPGNVSSQFVSALLMTGPNMAGGLTLSLTAGVTSRPYIDLTVCTMREYGADIEWTDVNTITVKPKPYDHKAFSIENDWSAASYWYEVLALLDDAESRLVMPGLLDSSRQGDSVTRYIFLPFGVKTAFAKMADDTTDSVVLTRHRRTLPTFNYDFVNFPDLAQTLAATCIGLEIPFKFSGLATLRIKETDRIEALRHEFRKLGYVVEVSGDDEMSWKGVRCEATMEPIDTYGDHRMAMAFAPLAIKYPGLVINDPHVVTKSYPRFWDDLAKAGFKIDEL